PVPCPLPAISACQKLRIVLIFPILEHDPPLLECVRWGRIGFYWESGDRWESARNGRASFSLGRRAGGNVEHLAEHGLSLTEWESIFEDCYDEARSRSSGLPVRFGFLGTQRFLIAFYWVEESSVHP